MRLAIGARPGHLVVRVRWEAALIVVFGARRGARVEAVEKFSEQARGPGQQFGPPRLPNPNPQEPADDFPASGRPEFIHLRNCFDGSATAVYCRFRLVRRTLLCPRSPLWPEEGTRS